MESDPGFGFDKEVRSGQMGWEWQETGPIGIAGPVTAERPAIRLSPLVRRVGVLDRDVLGGSVGTGVGKSGLATIGTEWGVRAHAGTVAAGSPEAERASLATVSVMTA